MTDRQGASTEAGFSSRDLEKHSPTNPSSPASSITHVPGRDQLTRECSHNGYGMDEAEAKEDPQPTEKDPYEVGWDGEDSDPLCPRSFSPLRKWLITIIVCNCTFCLTAGSSIYTSTYTQMEAEFHNSREISILGLSLFVLGIALGPLPLSPLSEFYGRKPIYVLSWGLYVIWIIPQAVAQNIQTVLVARFFAGLAGSAFMAVSGGTVGDLFVREQIQTPMAFFTISPFIGPSVGPLIGSFICYNVDWRWTWYVCIIWSFVLLVCVVFLVPETNHPVLLRKKAAAIRKETGDDRYLAPTEKVSKSVAHAVGRSLLRPFQLLFIEYMVLILAIYSAILLGMVYLFFGAFPLVYSETYGFNLWQTGLTFMGLLVGMILATLTDPFWRRLRVSMMTKPEDKAGAKGSSEPELRLPPTIFGSFLCPAGIFMFGWSAYPWVHWIVPIIGSAIFGFGVVLCFTGIFTFLVDAYPAYAASALAANVFVRCVSAAVFPLFGDQMYERLGTHWASSLLAFLTVAMVPFPFLFFKYGKQIRGKSRYASG